MHYFGSSFARPFTQYQKEWWEWGWEVEADKYYRPRVECEPRGVGKSTSGEAWVVSLLARFRRKTIGYVSREDDKATQHFNAVKRKLENAALLTDYPHLRPRVQKYRNAFSSWSQDRLITEAGQIIVPITLMGSNRGFKSEDDVRFDLLILDDIDKIGESPDVRAKNLEILKGEILAAGYDKTLVVVLQNLIHRDSICSMVMDHRADVLSDRDFRGPYPLMKWYDAEKVDIEDEGTGKRWVITEGEPYDPAIDIPYCEALLNRYGKDTFDRECQQDVTKVEEDKDFREWNEIYHIVTWAEITKGFAAYGVDLTFGHSYHVPVNWNVGEGFDWGSTRAHPSVVAIVARPDRTSPFDDSHFVISEIVMPVFPYDPHLASEMVSPGRVAKAIKDRHKELYLHDSQIKMQKMSHEASPARNTMIQDLPEDLQIHFNKWKAARGSGVPQIQNLLEIDHKKPHPFRVYPIGHEKAGQPIMGRPRIYFVVADGQGELYCDGDKRLRVRGGTDDRGMARARFEMPLYSTRSTGQSKIDDDFVDAIRGLMATFGVPAQAKSQEQQREEKLRPEVRLPAIFSEEDPAIQQAKIQSRDLYLKRMRHEEERAANAKVLPARIRFRR